MDKYDELGINLLAASIRPGGIFAGLIDDMLGFNKKQYAGDESTDVVTDGANDQLIVPPLDE